MEALYNAGGIPTNCIYWDSKIGKERKKVQKEKVGIICLLKLLRINGDSNDKPMAMRSWSVAKANIGQQYQKDRIAGALSDPVPFDIVY